MYTSIYIHRIPRAHREEILAIITEASRLYREIGDVECTFLHPADLAAKYGCASFMDGISLEENEDVIVELNSFRNKSEHDAIMELTDQNERINELYDQLTKLMDVTRIIRGEFETAA